MKSVKNLAFSALLTLGAFSAITYTACNSDDCKDVVCQNGGTCVDGTCTCPSGYEGANCDVLTAAKFLGDYTVSEQCTLSGTVGPYSATITGSSANAVNILLQNFGDFNNSITVTGTVNGNTLTIAQQTTGGYTISGTGTYNNGIISISYTSQGAVGAAESCNATWTKQ